MLIQVNDLKKSYGNKATAFDALKGVSFQVEEGESIAITGKSGSGKTTLMHLLALLDTPTDGEVLINDLTSSQFNKKELNQMRNQLFGFVFQQFYMNSKDSVINNVMLPLKIAKVSKRERKKRALTALQTVDLADKAQNKANDLSGGQKQRLCIARALVNNPKIIFADEPTGNLDTATGEIIEELLFNLNKANNITLIIVTHDEELAARCDRQIVIKDGEIIGGTSK